MRISHAGLSMSFYVVGEVPEPKNEFAESLSCATYRILAAIEYPLCHGLTIPIEYPCRRCCVVKRDSKIRV